MNQPKGKLKNQPDMPLEQVYEVIYKVSKDLSNCGNCDKSKCVAGVTAEGVIINYLTCDKGITIDPKKKCADWGHDLGSKL